MARMERSARGKLLRRYTRRYSSQRDEFYHAKHVLSLGEKRNRLQSRDETEHGKLGTRGKNIRNGPLLFPLHGRESRGGGRKWFRFHG